LRRQEIRQDRQYHRGDGSHPARDPIRNLHLIDRELAGTFTTRTNSSEPSRSV
jgi:hypothetical protein